MITKQNIVEVPHKLLKHAPLFDDVYGKYIIMGNEPARETIAVKTLPMNVNVEISMIAVL